jgi:hypothetical protein
MTTSNPSARPSIDWDSLRVVERIGGTVLPSGAVRRLTDDEVREINDRVRQALLLLEPAVDLMEQAHSRYFHKT